MKSVLVFAAAVALMPSMSNAATHSKTQTLTVRGSVSQNCLLTTQPVTFPQIGIGYLHNAGKTVYAQSALGMRCTKGAVAQISMNAGLYGNKAGSQWGNRSMKSTQGKNYLGYDLCHDSACASLWSTTTASSYTSPSDAGSSLPVWGRIITGQQADAGTYTDSVTVTVSF
jgi:spore coat protein U-like protein